MEQLPKGSPGLKQLYSESEVNAAITRIADAINGQLTATAPLVITLLNGGLIFSGQLLPLLDFPLQQDYLHATRYGDATQGSQLRWVAKPQSDLRNRTILLLDDIYDRGFTLDAVMSYCVMQGAAEVFSAVLLKKIFPDEMAVNKANYQPDFIGLQCGDVFVVGSGMDYQGYGRNIPGIYAIEQEIAGGQ